MRRARARIKSAERRATTYPLEFVRMGDRSEFAFEWDLLSQWHVIPNYLNVPHIN